MGKAEVQADSVATTGTTPVPLILGVTGHLDIDAGDSRLVAAVRGVFEEITAHHPERALILLTPLARGADTLVAQIALEYGARLIVPLPLPPNDYAHDFAGDARSVFDGLIRDPRVLRRIDVPQIESARASDEQTRRELQYLVAGAYVARYCDIMIALWDGRESGKVGGTAQVVRYRSTGSFDLEEELRNALATLPEPFRFDDNLLDPSDVGPIYHIVTPRPGVPLPADAFERRYDEPLGREEEHEIAAKVRQFNAQAKACLQRDLATVEGCAQQLFPGGREPSPGAESLRTSFAVADALSSRYQRFVRRGLLTIFVLIFLAAAALALFADGFAHGQTVSRVMLSGYVALLTVADAIFLFVMSRAWQDKHQDYRAVAEGLRVQFYWRLAGLEHNAADYYVRKQRDELTWIAHAVRSCGIVASPAADDQLVRISDLWVDGQAAYYNTARTRAQRSLRWRYAGSGFLAFGLVFGLVIFSSEVNGGLATMLLFASAAVLVLHVVLKVFGKLNEERDARESGARVWDVVAYAAGFAAATGIAALAYQMPGWLERFRYFQPTEALEWLLIGLGSAAAIGALLHGYSEIQAFEQHARHYSRMAAVFTRASQRMRALLDTHDHARVRRLIVELGKEALGDHGDWVMLHRERPIEVPEAGA